MIKNNECKVLITTKNIKYYTDRGFKCLLNEEISIDISKVSDMSHNLITAICDICSSEKDIPYYKYNTNVKRGGFYSCKKCSYKKRIDTNISRYGVDNIFKRDDVRENNKKWMSSREFRDKSTNTQIKKYGCLFVQTDDFKNEISYKNKEVVKTKKENGSYNCPLSLPINRELRENAMFEKYGQTYSSHVESIKSKTQKTNLEKYNHISPFGNKEIQNNIKKILSDKYGVDNIFKSEEFQNKIRKEREIKYKNIDIELFKEYRKSVRLYTNRNRKILFEKWDGIDYYDGEYIKGFLKYSSNNINYPTIDHKISCIFGFKNKILPEEISKIENLCITKRIINSKKSHLNEEDFIRLINVV